jgi:hypothetical protein
MSSDERLDMLSVADKHLDKRSIHEEFGEKAIDPFKRNSTRTKAYLPDHSGESLRTQDLPHIRKHCRLSPATHL